MIINCPFCHTALDVGDETRSIVAVCYRTQKSCSNKQWANPKTRVLCAAEDEDAREPEKVTHVIQTDPPWAGEEALAELNDQQLARGNHPDP